MPKEEEMKITRSRLRRIIKEELVRLNESNGEDYLNGQRAEAIGLIIKSISQIAELDKIEISRHAKDALSSELDNGSWRVSQKSNPTQGVDNDEHRASLDWEVEDLQGVLENAGFSTDEAIRAVYDIDFISSVSIIKSVFDKEFGEGTFDALEVDDTFLDASELSTTISQRIDTPASKKEYTGPKGKGQTRYIVTSQLTTWHNDNEADYNSAVFYLVDTVDGTKFEVRGDELPYMLPTTEGQLEIFDILPAVNSKESNLVADLNGKEFRLARKDI